MARHALRRLVLAGLSCSALWACSPRLMPAGQAAEPRAPTAQEQPPVPPSAKPALAENQSPPAPATAEPVTLEGALERRAAAASNAFGLDVLHALAAAAPSENVVCSPLSLSEVLGMAYVGARGATSAEMARVLHFEHISRTAGAANATDVMAAFRALRSVLAARNSQQTKLRVANSAWLSPGAKLLPDYRERVTAAFGSPPKLVDFAQGEAAREAINRWVAQKTERMIPELLGPDSLPEGTQLTLVNAVFFDGKWASPFAASDTRLEPFHLLGGSSVRVSLMSQALSAPYLEAKDFQVLDVPYAGGKLSLLLILPAAGRFAEVAAKLTPNQVSAMVEKLEERRVALSLPKLALEVTYDAMAQTLQTLGMSAAFAAAADFSGMSHAQLLKVDRVVHAAVVEMDEQGTRAAAATVATIDEIMDIEEQMTVMKIDRPYLFAIRERATGALLFIGRIVDPS